MSNKSAFVTRVYWEQRRFSISYLFYDSAEFLVIWNV